jgi:hypothetical protein
VKTIQHPVKKLIAQGEHQQLDFKFEISDARKIAKTLVAFANTDGGTLLVGVKDNGNIAGVRTEEEYYMIDAAANLYCNPKVPFEISKWVVDGKTVLEVYVPKSTEVPHFAKTEPNKQLAYLRVNDENILASTIHLKVWKNRAKPRGVMVQFSDTEKKLLGYLNNNEFISVSKFCRLAMITRREAENILATLTGFQLIDIVYSNETFLFRKATEK